MTGRAGTPARAVIDSLSAAGTSKAVLSFAHGEASRLHAAGDLGVVRAAELAAAAALMVSEVLLLDHADGALPGIELDILVDDVVRYATAVGAGGLLVFDLGGITGHPDHQRATEATAARGRATPTSVTKRWRIGTEDKRPSTATHH